MPVADFKTFCRMLENAQSKGYAIPAINVSSMTTANACLKAFADKKSDGIIQVSTGGGQFASGLTVNDSAEGAAAIAEFVHRMARRYNIFVALQTDHCPPDKVEPFLMPLIRETQEPAGQRIAEPVQQPHVRRLHPAPSKKPGYGHLPHGPVRGKRAGA